MSKSKSGAVEDSISRSELSKAVMVAAEVYRGNSMGDGVGAHIAMTFDGHCLRTSTFAAAVQFPLETKFKMTVDGRVLSKIVGALVNHGADDVEISVKDSDIAIKSGRSNAELIVFGDEASPLADIGGADVVAIDADKRAALMLGMTQALRSAGVTDIRHYLNGVHFVVADGNLVILGSDGLTITCVNTGMHGLDKFDGLSLTRDTAEALISIAAKIDDVDDEMQILRDDEGVPTLFGWKFSNGAEFRATVAESYGEKLVDAMEKVEGMNKDKLKSAQTPDGLVDALSAGKIAAEQNSPVKFTVSGGSMTVETGAANAGIIYRTKDISTELGDTEAGYNMTLLEKISKNPCDQFLFYEDGPLYFGNVDIDDSGVGVRTFLMPMRI